MEEHFEVVVEVAIVRMLGDRKRFAVIVDGRS